MVQSIVLPLVYLGGLALVFWFVGRWNKRNQALAAKIGYFPANLAQQAYEELAEQFSPEDANGIKILQRALMLRAMEAVKRVMKIREEKPPLEQLVSQSMIGEELLHKINIAEKELELELQQVMEESEMYKPGWGQSIFQEASNLVQIALQRDARQEAEQLRQEELLQLERRAEKMIGDDDENDKENSQPAIDELDEEKRKSLVEELIREEEAEKKKAAAKKSPPSSKKTSKSKK